MDLKRLRTFVTVAEQGSVSKAALRLHLTQPALSRQIRDLQAELGIQLFDHVGRRYPHVEMKLVEAVGPDIQALLQRGEVHLGLLLQADRADDSHFASYPVPPVELLAACHPSFPLQRGRTIEISRVASHPLLLLDSGFLVRRTFDAACRLAGLKPKILIESRAPSNLLTLAEAGHGVAVIPSVVLTHRHALRIVRLSHDGKPLREPLSIVWDKRRVLPRYARDFSEMLAVHMRDLFPIKQSMSSRAIGGTKLHKLHSS